MDLDTPAARRATGAATVLLLHVGLIAGLISAGGLPPAFRAVLPARLIMEQARPKPPPPPIPIPLLAAAPPMTVPLPEIAVAVPKLAAAPRAVSHAPTSAPAGAHFGAATDSGLGLDIGTQAGGGAGARGSLAGWQESVRRLVLAGRRQPQLAWDRRDTCVVNYRVTIGQGGRLARYSIDPCGVPEINQAARDAISQASYPPPPDLGGATEEVSGTLIFRPAVPR